MTLDDEGKELILRLQDFENRIISDKLVEESIYDSIKSLEIIFGKHSKYSEIIDKFKSIHKTDQLDVAINKSIKKTNTCIEAANASVLVYEFNINKNSVLSDFLADTGRLPAAKLRSFHEFFKKTNPNLEKAFENGDTNEVQKVLREYIEILESEEQYLKDNIYKISGDLNYSWSLRNLMNHEMAHIIFGEISGYTNIYAMALNEAYSFSLQKLRHTFEKEYIFTEENLSKEINDLYRFIVPRREGYLDSLYLFMKPLILFISTLVLCDAIARKMGDFKNNELFVKSYSSPTLIGINILIDESIEGLADDKFKKIIRNTLLKTALSQLNKCKETVIKDAENNLKKLPDFTKHNVLRYKESENRTYKIITTAEDWNNFKASLIGPGGSILSNNLRQFAASIDLLRVMGSEDIAKEYRDKYIQVLSFTLDEIAKSHNDAESQIYKQEKDVIDGIIKVIGQEEQVLVAILQELKF